MRGPPRYPETSGPGLPKRRRVWKLRAEIQARARKVDGIDRDAAWAAKRAALKLVYRVPRSAGRELAFEAYKAREGQALTNFATWCALAEKHGGNWHHWPAGLQHPAGPEVAEFVERGRSGGSLERPKLQRMLEYIQDRPVDFVIVHKIDRLARNRADDAAITKTIRGAGAYLVSTTEAISTTPSGRLLPGIMASIWE